MKPIALVCSLLLYWGCSSNLPTSSILELDEGTPVTGKTFENELIIPNVRAIDVIEGKLILMPNTRKYVLLQVDERDGSPVSE